MYKKIVALTMSAVLVVSGLTVSTKEVDAAVVSSNGSGSWNLVWSDEFNQNVGSAPSSENWQYDIGHGSDGWGNKELQYYTDSTTNVAIANVDGAVDGKALRITAQREGDQITSGRIKSLDRQYVKYGKIEARIKTSNGMQPGVWPAFWMMGNDIHTNNTGWPRCGEIDILEHRNTEQQVISTLHWNVNPDGSYSHDYMGSEKNGQFGKIDSMDNWHTYAVEWYEDCMKFFVDGNCYETIALTEAMKEEFHKPHFILLNLAIGSQNTPFTLYTTVENSWQTSSMYVDYVRVYQGNDANFYRAKSSDTSQIVTTASPTAGMTACASDNWTSAGSVWDYNIGTSWAGASAYYSGGSQNDFSIYMTGASTANWGAMVRARQGVTAGHTYNYTINYNSTNAGSVLVKEDVSGMDEKEVGIVSGNGTITGSFTAGDTQSEAQILMDLRGISAGTKLSITGLSLTDTTQGGGQPVTTTQAPSQGGSEDTVIDWSGIAFAGDGAAGGAYTDKYKFYCDNSLVSLVNIQAPSWASAEGFYVTYPVAISSSSLGAGNYNIQGSGILLHLSQFTAKETKFTVKDANGTVYTCYVYYKDGTGYKEILDDSSAPEPTTPAPSTGIPDGFTEAAMGWNYTGNWGCYFGDWNGTASGAYKSESDNRFKVYYSTVNPGADWLTQVSYDAAAITGHTYKVTATITTDVAGSIGIKEDLSNGAADPVYTDLPVGTTVVTGEYTVTQDAIKVMFETGRGIAAGTTLSFDKIVIEDITEEPPTQAPIEETTASAYVRTVHVNTNGAAISADKKVDADIVIMDKIGGDSYEDSVVYDTISQPGTIKVRGNSTANADKKPYNISFESKQEVFGMGTAKKWSLLANAFDKSLIRNRLAMEFATDLGLAYTSESTYVDLYVNGEYYGNYLLIESVEAGSDRVDIDTDNGSDILLERERDRSEDGVSYITTSKYGIRFAVGEPEDIDTASAHYTNTVKKLNDFETALESKDYNAISQYIDVDSFVNFYIVNELFKNIDFNFSSTRFYVKDGKIYAGPLWDLDLSSGNASSSFYPNYYEDGVSYKGLWCQDFTWFRLLMENDTFKHKVAKRYKEVQPLITNMITGNTGNSIDALAATYAEAFAMNYTPKSQGGAGWTIQGADSADPYSYSGQSGWTTYADATTFLRNWLSDRNAYLLEEFSEDVTISDDIEINGFQISTLVEGIRTVYSTDSKVEGQNVKEIGLIYGIEFDGFSKDDMIYGSDNKYVAQVAGTEEKGRLDKVFSKSASYAMTMTFGGDDAIAYNSVYNVRVYAVLEDGSIVYSNIDTYTVYDVADVLYKGKLMSTAIGHEYLYEKILYPMNNSYVKIEYGWENILAPV